MFCFICQCNEDYDKKKKKTPEDVIDPPENIKKQRSEQMPAGNEQSRWDIQ